MKNIWLPVVAFFSTHFLCCGALLAFLITSGYLLAFHHIGVERKFFIPALIISVILFFIYREYNKCFKEVNRKTFFDRIAIFVLYLAFSFSIGIIFMIYFFLPWWLPNYTGGFLLP